MRDGKRPQRLGGDPPAIRQDGQLAAARTDHRAMHVDDVAQVDIGFPCVESSLADLVEADHHLQLGTIAVLKCRKA
ncbi:Uncharacterised protein [Mycobacterium tuberculosis]|nr:Uncharacterised protein [Mycobacterium tuberculosis]